MKEWHNKEFGCFENEMFGDYDRTYDIEKMVEYLDDHQFGGHIFFSKDPVEV